MIYELMRDNETNRSIKKSFEEAIAYLDEGAIEEAKNILITLKDQDKTSEIFYQRLVND